MSSKKLEGFTKLAVIKQGCQDYYYAIYDDGFDYKIGDRVLVSGGAYQQTWAIKDFAEPGTEPKNIIAEVICPVDYSAYEARVEARKRKEELKKKLTNKAKEIDETTKYKFYAQHNAEFAELLEEYQSL